MSRQRERVTLELLDENGRQLPKISEDEARDLIRKGFGRSYGSKSRAYGVRLTVPTVKALGIGERSLTSMVRPGAASRMHCREHVADKYYIWQLRDVPKSVRGLFMQALVPGTRASAVSGGRPIRAGHAL